jgi:hypothetical protein
VLALACGLLAVAAFVFLHAWSSNEARLQASPEPVDVAPARDSESNRLAAVEPASDQQRIEAVAPPAAMSPPAESVKAKLERLTLEAHLTPEGGPVTDLEGEVQRIEHLIYESTREEFEYRFAQRIGLETLSTDPNYKYDGKGYDPESVYWVRFTPGGPTEKVTLPKDEFPEIYELKAKSATLRFLLDHPGLTDPEPVEDR